MILIKTFVVVFVLFVLCNSSGAAPSNSSFLTLESTVDWCINNPCGKRSTCHNSPSSYTCTCHPGYEAHGARCRDINECFVHGKHLDEKICGEHTKCTNTPGSFVCTCDDGYYRKDFQCFALPRDCADIRVRGRVRTSGVYTVYIGESRRTLDVYCDMTTGSVGWTVFQRRQDGGVTFYRNWADYETGFGNFGGDFWIGNENLHLITSSKRYKLRVELTAFDGSTAFAEYDDFRVASAADKYRLTSIGHYSGTAGEALSFHVGEQFSTNDNDNDKDPGNCAEEFEAPWWHHDCFDCNLNGKY